MDFSIGKFFWDVGLFTPGPPTGLLRKGQYVNSFVGSGKKSSLGIMRKKRTKQFGPNSPSDSTNSTTVDLDHFSSLKFPEWHR